MNYFSSFCLSHPLPLLNGRGGNSSRSTTVGERLLSTLLTEMDGLEQAKVSTKFSELFSISVHFKICFYLFVTSAYFVA